MTRNLKELQARMHPANRADNVRAVREKFARMALDELRNAKRLTQAYLAEMLDTPQSSISRTEQRADMYLSFTPWAAYFRLIRRCSRKVRWCGRHHAFR